MSTKFYSIRVEVPIHHEVWPKVLAFLGWLKGQGIDSEVSTVTVSTPPQPKSYFVGTEFGRMSRTRDQVVQALRELGPSRTKEVAAHLGWGFQRASSGLSRLGKVGLAVRKGRCVWELVPAGTVVVPRVGSSSSMPPPPSSSEVTSCDLTDDAGVTV